MTVAVAPRVSIARNGILWATVLGSSVSFIDTTAVNVALPAIGRDLDAGLSGLQWTIDSYVFTLASLMVVSGALGDRFGRRRVFVIGLVAFAAASALCAMAWSIESLIIARALQGVAGSLMIPNSLAVLRASFPQSEQGRMIGAWTAWSGITTVAAPFLGGWLVDTWSWRLIFAINLPLLAAAAYLALRCVPAFPARADAPPLDWPAIPAVIVAFGGITYGLIERDWLLAGIGLLALPVLIWREQRARDPLIPLELFSIRNFSFGNASTVAVYAALGGSTFVLTLLLQNIAGYSAMQTGAASAPISICMVILAARFGGLAGKYGPRWFMAGGPLLIAVALAWLSRLDGDPAYVQDILGPMIVFGIGLSVVVAPLTAAVIGAAPESHAGVASAINTAMARLGTTLAVAAVGLAAQDGFTEAAYGSAMLMCAALALGGAVIAAAGIRTVPATAEAGG